ncbi:F0F1 ATP synthase subunit gamma, partial [Enterobacter hormaechei subsp. steigerwaltii]|nr:F0F1 ATP synthase subunit gamma [Enterobacter hormaechei subsp. steigerwaltii]
MAVGKEILTKIRSVQNTQKITKAMQMVSTSKMRKTQERMRLARPYAEKVRMVMSHLAQTNTDHGIPLLESHREIRRVGFILITSD